MNYSKTISLSFALVVIIGSFNFVCATSDDGLKDNKKMVTKLN